MKSLLWLLDENFFLFFGEGIIAERNTVEIPFCFEVFGYSNTVGCSPVLYDDSYSCQKAEAISMAVFAAGNCTSQFPIESYLVYCK